MKKVELIFDGDCPNAEKARESLKQAFGELGLEPGWIEWDRADASAPGYVLEYGSPTILVDGRDVGGVAQGEGDSCRVYSSAEGMTGAPPHELIVDALKRGEPAGEATGMPGGAGRLVSNLAVAPGLTAALLPALTCPACWPVYAGLLGSMGVGFLANKTYLLPITAVLFAIALGALAWRASYRRGYGPLILGAFGAAGIIAGKFFLSARFVYDWNPLVYGGMALFIAASLWNTWPRAKSQAADCPACEQVGVPGNQQGISDTATAGAGK